MIVIDSGPDAARLDIIANVTDVRHCDSCVSSTLLTV